MTKVQFCASTLASLIDPMLVYKLGQSGNSKFEHYLSIQLPLNVEALLFTLV